jgi:hypothetical protein
MRRSAGTIVHGIARGENLRLILKQHEGIQSWVQLRSSEKVAVSFFHVNGYVRLRKSNMGLKKRGPGEALEA